MDKNKKILISVIHNNNEKRLSYLRPFLDRIACRLKEISDVSVVEVSYQPDLKYISFSNFLLKQLIFFRATRNWRKYRKGSKRLFIIDIFLFISMLCKNTFFIKSGYKKLLKLSTIEMYLTDKHISAFKLALELKVDYLIVFEDDAIFRDDSIERMLDLIEIINSKHNDPIYIDLAGGLNLDGLGILNLELKRNNQYIYFSKPVTNGAGCYLLNKKQIDIFYSYINRYPLLRYLGADWMINCLFIRQARDKIKSDCIHSYPSVFGHGSVDGSYNSLIR